MSEPNGTGWRNRIVGFDLVLAREQYVLTTAPDVFDFFRREFFEAMTRGD